MPWNCLAELIGRPGDEAGETHGQVVPALREAAERLAAEWEQQLAELQERLIERPGFRLAGAEEGIRHVVAGFEKSLQHYEPMLRDLKEKAASGYTRLQEYIASSKNGRKPSLSTQELLELLKSYPKWRYQSLVMQHVISAFLGLRGHLSDELREVNFCRVRLTELLRLLEADGSSPGLRPFPKAGSAADVQLFPAGCKNLEEAAHTFLGDMDNETMLELDNRVQALLTKDFVDLRQVCLTNTGVLLRNLEKAMRETAETLGAEYLAETDAAEILLAEYPERDAVVEKLGTGFQEAEPSRSTAGKPAPELCVLAAPPGEAGDELREAARAAIPGVEMVNGSNDHILIYRETPYLPLGTLDHLGPAACDVYQQMCAAENFTPHTRIDVAFRR